ncbi:hypothetical protein M758_2G244300 [Ceratodon purpureus]|nr:hypothetical protein M758_2G244300 [Ceratodon purpureus]
MRFAIILCASTVRNSKRAKMVITATRTATFQVRPAIVLYSFTLLCLQQWHRT